MKSSRPPSDLVQTTPTRAQLVLRRGAFSMGLADVAAGGQALRTTSLSADLFAAAAMKVATKDLMAMKVAELKEELEAPDELKTGNKAWLRRRLHGAIVSGAS